MVRIKTRPAPKLLVRVKFTGNPYSHRTELISMWTAATENEYMQTRVSWNPDTGTRTRTSGVNSQSELVWDGSQYRLDALHNTDYQLHCINSILTKITHLLTNDEQNNSGIKYERENGWESVIKESMITTQLNCSRMKKERSALHRYGFDNKLWRKQLYGVTPQHKLITGKVPTSRRFSAQLQPHQTIRWTVLTNLRLSQNKQTNDIPHGDIIIIIVVI